MMETKMFGLHLLITIASIWLPILWSQIPTIAIVSDTSNRSHHGTGNYFSFSLSLSLSFFPSLSPYIYIYLTNMFRSLDLMEGR